MSTDHFGFLRCLVLATIVLCPGGTGPALAEVEPANPALLASPEAQDPADANPSLQAIDPRLYPAEAIQLYEGLERATDPSLSWAGTSGLVAVHRLLGNYFAAFEVTRQVAAMRPELTGLMLVWDGDTSVLAKDFVSGERAYRVALDQHGAEIVDGRAVGVSALRQLSKLYLETAMPAKAAEAQRHLVRDFGGFVPAELALARALAYEEMAHGKLPVRSLGGLLHDGACSTSAPCLIGDARGRSSSFPESEGRGLVPMAGLEGSLFHVRDDDYNLLWSAAKARRAVLQAPPASVTACVPSNARDGFQLPIANHHYGDLFMTYPASAGGYHPGVDLNGPGNDCNLDFSAVAQGCVTDASQTPTTWGSATIQHYYVPDNEATGYWTSQYGHANAVYYSDGAAILRGATLGNIDGVPNFSCHLHLEIREADHPSPDDADYYSASSQANVGNYNQDPETFIAAHRSYRSIQWVDEGAFSFIGTWNLITNVGDKNDLKYALTAATKTAYARYSYTPATSGVYELWMFVPWKHATSTRVPVKLVRTSNGAAVISAEINQFGINDGTVCEGPRCDEWVRVGEATLSAGVAYYIEVANNTAETNKKVAVDDFLIIRK